MTVDGFRDIWLQSAADPPGFDRRQVSAVEDGAGDDGQEGDAPESSELDLAEKAELDNSLAQAQAEADAEAESEAYQTLLDERELEAEINRHLHHEKFQEIQQQLDGQERMSYRRFPYSQLNFSVGLRREEAERLAKDAEDDNLSDLDDDDEVSGAIISEDSEHFILRAQLWIESNKEYLREQRGSSPPKPHQTTPLSVLHAILLEQRLMVEKRMREEEDERNGVKKNQPKRRRKKARKTELEEGESVPATPAESAKQMAKARAFSKKIDYSAMDKLFADD